VVVFKFFNENKDYVKRVIALEGDTVEIRNKTIYLNGKPLREDYVVFSDPKIYDGLSGYSREEFQEYWEKGFFCE
jgi:signal peptidase I